MHSPGCGRYLTIENSTARNRESASQTATDPRDRQDVRDKRGLKGRLKCSELQTPSFGLPSFSLQPVSRVSHELRGLISWAPGSTDRGSLSVN